MPMSISSVCILSTVIVSSSAVGVGLRKSSRIGRQNSVWVHEMSSLRSFLDLELIGLVSVTSSRVEHNTHAEL